MRTIQVEISTPLAEEGASSLAALFGQTAPTVRISTEVVLADDSEESARQAGAEARTAIEGFLAGYAEGRDG